MKIVKIKIPMTGSGTKWYKYGRILSFLLLQIKFKIKNAFIAMSRSVLLSLKNMM